MDIERLRKIIQYSKENRQETNSMIKIFCAFSGIEYDNSLLDILQIVRSSFRKKGFLVFQMPFADDEIGALSYRGDGLGYVVINTSLPRVNVNFAIAHEIYHTFFQKSKFISKVKFSDDHYYEHEEEYAANLFAGMLLMPEAGFRRMYNKFKEESEGKEIDIMIQLMAYYRVPYMSVLIRCLELELLESVSEELLNITRKQMQEKLNELWLDESILIPSNADDYRHIESFVEGIGNEFIKDGYLNERTLRKVLENMSKLYKKIKGE